MNVLGRFRRADDDGCRCDPSFVEPTGTGVSDRVELIVESDDCPGRGDLARDPDCRATVIDALARRDADAVRTRSNGRERTYADDAAALLLAAGRFAERVAFHDERLAELARRDPLRAAREATGRAGPVSTVVAETGLAEGAHRASGYEAALRPFVGPTIARSRVAIRPPEDARLDDRWALDTGATVRLYRTDHGRRVYHIEPVAHALCDESMATLSAAAERLAIGSVPGGERAPGRAVRRVADDDEPVERLSAVLRAFTRGHGVLDDLFADPRVSDAFVTAPVTDNPVRAVVDGERMRTNVRLTPGGASALASRFRRASGRSFSRANPTIDAVVDSAAGEGGGTSASRA
uniref:hypothetical protein n=1 Tax=Halegenticoccus tardaugens TaxID=2071624 RepID=UPI002B26EFB4|nr:hypothetical protein [Halegenticoccus tardaugens]